jgi:hypothetical protein
VSSSSPPVSNFRATVARSKNAAPLARPLPAADTAAAPMTASSWSSSAEEAPLTPTAPTT